LAELLHQFIFFFFSPGRKRSKKDELMQKFSQKNKSIDLECFLFSNQKLPQATFVSRNQKMKKTLAVVASE